MRLPGLYVTVSGDLTQLEADLERGKSMVVDKGEIMARAFGEKVANGTRAASEAYAEFAQKVVGHLKKVDDEEETFCQRHSGKIKLLGTAVAVAAIDSQWDKISSSAKEASDTIGNALTKAYQAAGEATGGWAEKSKAGLEMFISTAGKAGSAMDDLARNGLGLALEKIGGHFDKTGKEAREFAAELDRLSHYTGISVEELARAKDVSHQTGVSFEQMTSISKALADAQAGVSDKGKQAAQQLAALGVSLKDAQGNAKSSEQIMAELAGAINALGDKGPQAGEKIKALGNVIGQVDKDTLDLFNEGKEMIEARLEEAKRLSDIFTKEMASGLNAYKKELQAVDAEERAWAQRRELMAANLGRDLKHMAASLFDGQTSLWQGLVGSLQAFKGYFEDWVSDLLDKYKMLAKGINWIAQDLLKTLGLDNLAKKLEEKASGDYRSPVIKKLQEGGGPEPGKGGPGGFKALDFSGSKSGRDKELELQKFIDSIAGSALSEQAGLLGDKYGAQQLAAWKDYTNEIDNLRQKLNGFAGENKEALEKAGHYWAAYRLGIKLAKAELEATEAYLSRWAEVVSRVGELEGDPGKTLTGKLVKLALDQRKIEREINADSIMDAESKESMLAQVREKYRLEEIKAKETTLGEAAKLDDAYWLRRQAGLENMDRFLQQQGVNEHARAVYMAQERDKLHKSMLEARIGYEENFGSYLSDRLALNYGLYKSEAGKTLETWEKMAEAIIKGIDGISDAFSWTFGQVMGDLITGKFKSVENYTEQLMAQLKQAFASFITDLAKIAMQRYIVVPIIGQIMGTEGSFGLEGMSGLGTKGGDGASLGSLTKYAGYGKDAYNMYRGGSSWVNSLDTWGYDTLGIGTATSFSQGAIPMTAAQEAMAVEMGGTAGLSSTYTGASAVSGGLGSMAAAGGMGAAAGGLAGQFLRPDNPSSSYAGTGVGLGAGMLASYMGAGSWAGPIGMAAALVAAAITAAVTPETKKYSWAVPNSSQPAMFVAGGDILPASYGVVRTTTSGMFGSTDTKHTTIFGMADPKMAAAQEANWKAANAGLDTFTKAVGVSAEALKSAKSSFNFPAIPIPEGYEAEVYRNVANAQAEHVLTQTGMIDAIKGVAKEGEAYIDTLGRLSVAFSAMENIGIATGFRLEDIARGMDRIAATDYASRLMEAAGGADALSAALARLSVYGYSGQERLERGLTATAEATGRAIAGIGDMSVTIENFWVKFREATERGLDPANVQAWVVASARMEQWEQVKAAAQQKQTQALQQNISVLQQQISVIQQASQQWKAFGDQLVKLKHSLLMDKSLSPLSPLEKMNTAKARLDGLTAEANAKGTEHLADIDQATKDYLTASLEYYGATADYYAIFNATSATIDQLESLAGAQVSEAAQQIAQLQFQIEQGNAQIMALNNINQGVGEVVSAVNNVSSAIGGAIQAANAAQRNANIPQWAASAIPADSVAATSPFGWPGVEEESGSAYQNWITSMGLDVPRYATGGTTGGGWFVAGDDPLESNSGELIYSPAPARVFSNRESRAMLSRDRGGKVDTSALEAKVDALGAVLVDILNVLEEGGGTAEAVRDLRRAVKSKGFKEAGL